MIKNIREKTLAGFRPFPLHLNIESSNRCNLACIMCPHPFMERDKGNMKFDTFRRIIDEVKDYGIQSMWLHILGEPLLNPQIFEFVRYSKQYDNLKNVGFSTNCTYLDETRAKELLFSGLDHVVLALDGIDKETYETIRVRGNYEVATENVERFLRLRKEIRPDLEVQLSIINLKLSHKEVERYREYWRPFLLSDKELVIKPFVNFGGQVNNQLGFDNHQENGHSISYPCSTLWKSLSVLWNGDVSVCCLDSSKEPQMKVGNVWEQSLQDIWLGELQTYYRTLHLKQDLKKIPLCDACNLNRVALKVPFVKR